MHRHTSLLCSANAARTSVPIPSTRLVQAQDSNIHPSASSLFSFAPCTPLHISGHRRVQRSFTHRPRHPTSFNTTARAFSKKTTALLAIPAMAKRKRQIDENQEASDDHDYEDVERVGDDEETSSPDNHEEGPSIPTRRVTRSSAQATSTAEERTEATSNVRSQYLVPCLLNHSILTISTSLTDFER